MPNAHGVLAVVGANPVGDSRRSGEAADCSAHHPPQCMAEPAGSPLGAVSAGEGFERTRPAGGRPWMAGRFRGGRDSRLENPRSKPDPARRAISKRRGAASLAGRRRRGPEGATRRLFPILKWVVGRAACRFPAPSAIANRVGSHHSRNAMRTGVPQSALGRSQPCWRTLRPTKANEAMRHRQASGPSNEARPRSPTRSRSTRRLLLQRTSVTARAKASRPNARPKASRPPQIAFFPLQRNTSGDLSVR